MTAQQKTLTQSTFAHSAMVTSPHTVASEVGLKILKQGGNAVEAAIGIAVMLSVTYPHFNGLGGDAFMLLSDAKGNVSTISGIGQAFENLPKYVEKIPERGIHSAITTACTVDTWGKAYDFATKNWQQRCSWEELFKPAINACVDGIVVTASQQYWFNFRQANMQNWSGFEAVFTQNGMALSEGDNFKQLQLGKTLQHIAKYGARAFYEGELAEKIVDGLQAFGSTIQLSDLDRTHARIEEPLQTPYRNGVLCSLQPPTQGVTTLEIMGILQQFNLPELVVEGSANYYHVLVEAIKEAFIDRNQYVADPDFTQFDATKLLLDAHLKQRSENISMQKALPWGEVYQHGDTVYIGVVDSYGNCVSMLQTIYYDWGSGVMAGDTGVLWHNRGASFSLNPQHPNVLKPFKRPFHTLNPGIYLKNNKPALLYGTQGADGQPQTLATILTRLIDYKYLPYEALQQPRFLLGKTFSNSQDMLKIEKDVNFEVVDQLTMMGHEIDLIGAQSPLAGQPGVILIGEDGLYGAHDPRSDGVALGF